METNSQPLRGIHSNAGLTAAYRIKLLAFIDEMEASIAYWLRAAYRAHEPAVAAMDASPVDEAQRYMDDLARRWLRRIDESAPKIAESYVTQQYKASNSAFRQALKDAGWTIDFKFTAPMRDTVNASIGENIALIKSIPERYLSQVEGAVYRSYANGHDLQTMVREIQEIYPVVRKRAIFIARDQSNKLNAAVLRTRQLDLGITDAIWMHSGGGKKPRPDHVQAGSEHRRYKIADGCLISGKYIQPGVLPNCRCVGRCLLPGR